MIAEELERRHGPKQGGSGCDRGLGDCDCWIAKLWRKATAGGTHVLIPSESKRGRNYRVWTGNAASPAHCPCENFRHGERSPAGPYYCKHLRRLLDAPSEDDLAAVVAFTLGCPTCGSELVHWEGETTCPKCGEVVD